MVAHLIRATERFNDRMGNQFGAAITYFSFLSMIPILMVSFAAAGFVLASHPTLLQDIFNKILNNVTRPDAGHHAKKPSTPRCSNVRPSVWSACWSPSIRGKLDGQPARNVAPNRARSGSAGRRTRRNLGKYLRDLISLIGLLVALITLSITSVAGSAQQMIISALYLDNIEWLKPAPRGIGLAISIFANYLLFFWIFWRLPRHRPRQEGPVRGTLIAAIGFEMIKIVMTRTLPSLVKSPSGAAFGSVLGLMAFSISSPA